MDRKITLITFALCLLWLQTTIADTLDTVEQKQSYAVGYNIASNLKKQGIKVDINSFMQAVKDAFADNPKMNETELQQVLNDLSNSLRETQNQANKSKLEANTKEGDLYMAKNKKDSSVKQTDSGLQYKIIRLGKGKMPKKSDRVKVHYAGTFVGGDEFDSSYKRGSPSVFGLTQVIPGWTEVLQLMPVGSKFQVVIPGNLAYGLNAPPSIGPNRTLLFDIELIAIE